MLPDNSSEPQENNSAQSLIKSLNLSFISHKLQQNWIIKYLKLKNQLKMQSTMNN